MKTALSLTLVALTLPSTALAEGPRCDNARLMKTLSQFIGGAELEVTSSQTEVVVARVATASKKGETLQPALAVVPVMKVTCDTIDIPLANDVERPTRGPSRTVQISSVTVSKTARGAVSLDIAAGALQREAVQVLLLDDQSMSLTRGKDVLYAISTRPDGTVVETEGRGVGCGCVRTTTSEGQTSTRPL